jgi:hypothetical protein
MGIEKLEECLSKAFSKCDVYTLAISLFDTNKPSLLTTGLTEAVYTILSKYSQDVVRLVYCVSVYTNIIYCVKLPSTSGVREVLVTLEIVDTDMLDDVRYYNERILLIAGSGIRDSGVLEVALGSESNLLTIIRL